MNNDWHIEYDRRLAIKEAKEFIVELIKGKHPCKYADALWKLAIEDLQCLLHPPIYVQQPTRATEE